MKHQTIQNNHSRNIILFFAGWGMDATPFRAFTDLGKDCMIVYDYSDFKADFDISGYSGYYVVAWSFGVYAAAYWLATQKKKPLKAIAINGTLSPIDDECGIPCKIFDATLNGLSEKSLLKFIRRMCGNDISYNWFMENRPARTIYSLRNELITMKKISSQHPQVFEKWDVAYISEKDYIFPTDNQKKAWSGKSKHIVLGDEYHLPKNFIQIINSNIINKDLVKCRFGKSIHTYDSYAHGQDQIAEKLREKLKNADFHTGKTIYEAGCGTGLFTKRYVKTFEPSKLILNDIACIPEERFKDLAPEAEFLQGDAESVFPDEKPFYIVSASVIQWFENIPVFLANIHNLLDDNGYIALSTFGKCNYQELRPAFSSTLRYHSLEEWKEMLENAKFIIDELSEDKFNITFNSAKDLLKCLKHTGVNAITTPQKINKDKYTRLQELLPHNNGKYSLTFNPIYIIAHKRK